MRKTNRLQIEESMNRFAQILSLSIAFTLLVSVRAQDKLDSQPVVQKIEDLKTLPTKIAFGSCGHQNHKQPILRTIVDTKPDLFVYLGDNIYGDTKDMNVLKQKYAKLGSKPEFQALRKNIPTLSVWDDHDYGWNDAGKEYEFKAESKQIFMEFWQVPPESDRQKHDGIYGVHYLNGKDSSGKERTVQIVLLDTRTFRDPLKRNSKPIPKEANFNGTLLKNGYQPDPDPAKTILGDTQWKWLAETLTQPADVRIICSSIQFGHEYNGWESWTNMPAQQQKMVDTIREAKANGVLFISGDVHWGEISRRDFKYVYPLFDVTASGLTMDWHNTEPNKFRVGPVFRENHFGTIEFDWSKPDPTLTFKIIDLAGKVQNTHVISLSELQFNDKKDN
jgi:alkaline phosphatase D